MTFRNSYRWLRFAWWRIAGGFPDWRKRGRFTGLDDITIRYKRPDLFDYLVNTEEPLAFHRGTEATKFVWSGESIQPEAMITDGGSVPRVAELIGLNRLTYLPAFIVHDWEYDQHHRGRSMKSKNEVNLTMLEAIYTLMMDYPEIYIPNEFRLRVICDAFWSPICEDVWNGLWLQS